MNKPKLDSLSRPRPIIIDKITAVTRIKSGCADAMVYDQLRRIYAMETKCPYDVPQTPELRAATHLLETLGLKRATQLLAWLDRPNMQLKVRTHAED